MTHLPGLLRTAPLQRETTSSLICRIAGRYGMEAKVLRACWKWRNYPPGHEGGGARADAEVLLNAAGRQLLANMCGVEEDVLARALPSWEEGDTKLRAEDGDPVGLWRIGWRGGRSGGVRLPSVHGPAHGDGSSGGAVRAAVGAGVCSAWAVAAGRGRQPAAGAPRPAWPAGGGGGAAAVARRAVRAGEEPERVFALAQAVVARWWEQALQWERETIWPQRLHQVAGGDAGGDLERWRIVGRDAVVFPEVVAVADALLDPAMAELVWADSGAGRPRALPADGMFCRRLGERLGRGWLGPLAAADHGGPLIAWMGSVIRRRRGAGGPPGYDNDPWWLRQEHQSSTMAGQMRVLGKEKKVPGSGTMWRAAVPAEQRRLITSAIDSAEEQLLQLRGVQTGPTTEVARRLLRGLGHSAGLIEAAWKRTAVAAVKGGVPLQEVARWVDMPVEVLSQMLTAGRQDNGG